MNHDITHCYGCDTKIVDNRIVTDESKLCPVRENCLRYLAQLEAKKIGLTRVSYKLGRVDNCTIYSRID